jgi:hypothetical protein
MGAGRAAGFDDETTDLGSVIGRSSGPVEAAKRVDKLQQMTTNSGKNWRIRILHLGRAVAHHGGLWAYSNRVIRTGLFEQAHSTH